jgi:hypothetical protein
MILGFFGSVYLNWVYLTWLPGYLEIERIRFLTRLAPRASLLSLIATANSAVDEVWVNTRSGKYWKRGSRYYGKTKIGRTSCRSWMRLIVDTLQTGGTGQ